MNSKCLVLYSFYFCSKVIRDYNFPSLSSPDQISKPNLHFFFKFLKINLSYYFYLWLLLCPGFSSYCEQGLLSSFSVQASHCGLWWLLLLGSTGSRVQAQQLWHTGLVAPRHVGSSQTRNQTLHWQADSQPLNHQGSPYCISIP